MVWWNIIAACQMNHWTNGKLCFRQTRSFSFITLLVPEFYVGFTRFLLITWLTTSAFVKPVILLVKSTSDTCATMIFSLDVQVLIASVFLHLATKDDVSLQYLKDLFRLPTVNWEHCPTSACTVKADFKRWVLKCYCIRLVTAQYSVQSIPCRQV